MYRRHPLLHGVTIMFLFSVLKRVPCFWANCVSQKLNETLKSFGKKKSCGCFTHTSLLSSPCKRESLVVALLTGKSSNIFPLPVKSGYGLVD